MASRLGVWTCTRVGKRVFRQRVKEEAAKQLKKKIGWVQSTYVGKPGRKAGSCRRLDPGSSQMRSREREREKEREKERTGKRGAGRRERGQCME